MCILKQFFINLYNLHLLIHLLHVLYSASNRHAEISAIEMQYIIIMVKGDQFE